MMDSLRSGSWLRSYSSPATLFLSYPTRWVYRVPADLVPECSIADSVCRVNQETVFTFISIFALHFHFHFKNSHEEFPQRPTTPLKKRKERNSQNSL